MIAASTAPIPSILLIHFGRRPIATVAHHLSIQVWLWPEVIRVKCLPDLALVLYSSLVVILRLHFSLALPVIWLVGFWHAITRRLLLLIIGVTSRLELRLLHAYLMHQIFLVTLFLKLGAETWQVARLLLFFTAIF